jgi:DnaJ-class molecular chaperone
MSLWITLRDAVEGGRRTISVGTHSGTHAVEIEIPLGINDGDNVQYSNVGPGGMDLVVSYRIHPDPKWQRQHLSLITEHVVPIWSLIVGGETIVKDILGNSLALTITPNTQPGTMVRLRNRGIKDRNGSIGDLLIKLQAKIPDQINSELLNLIRKENSQ